MLCLVTTKLHLFHTVRSALSIIRNLLFALNIIKTFLIVVFLIRFLASNNLSEKTCLCSFYSLLFLCHSSVLYVLWGQTYFMRRPAVKCTCNVTLMRFRLPMVAVESNNHYIF